MLRAMQLFCDIYNYIKEKNRVIKEGKYRLHVIGEQNE